MVVVGSANVDLFAAVPAIPAPGETVLARGREVRAGGKGLNQAVAAARAGAATTFVAVVGRDEGAEMLLAEAAAAGVDTGLVRRADGPTGTAWIMVRPDGENAIVVDGAANATLTSLTLTERTAVSEAAVVVAQLETPLSAVREAAEAAQASGARFLLNAAPASELPEELLRCVDVLVVNEHEARHLSGEADPSSAARTLLRLAGAVVVTLGAEGALLLDADGERRVPGLTARVVDTTGAGDTFTGVLAATLATDPDLDAAARRAVVAGALAVETAGAVPSIPTSDAIAARLRQEASR
ncbi:ribokinase [Nocardioides gansuensis]|uniref:Ribokinase n=1 Tax=Nocardioides gansuensis TaxID=2138300 RepID=A0A2T8FEC9_9ACTN|nr:ribokinase [Nocardioides gansuensis]